MTARQQTEERALRDEGLTQLLRETYGDEPALGRRDAGATSAQVQVDERTARVMCLVRTGARTLADARALADPALGEALRAAYAGDPALADAPGRTDRVMRVITAHGVRSWRQPWFGWGMWAGAAGAAALAAILIAGQFARQPRVAGHPAPVPGPTHMAPAPRPDTVQPVAPLPTPPSVVAPPTPVAPAPSPVPRPPAVAASKSGARRTPAPRAPVAPHAPVVVPPSPLAPVQSPLPDVPEPPHSPAMLASASVEAATVAAFVGDHAASASLYLAAYESDNERPNPEVLIASAHELAFAARTDLASGAYGG